VAKRGEIFTGNSRKETQNRIFQNEENTGKKPQKKTHSLTEDRSARCKWEARVKTLSQGNKGGGERRSGQVRNGR